MDYKLRDDLIRIAEDSSDFWRVRVDAIKALADDDDYRTKEKLQSIASYSSDDSDVRSAAIAALRGRDTDD